LCGGTHVRRTGDIGVCKIVYEESISAGVRRIEALTGEGALRQYQESTDALRHIAEMLKASQPEIVEHVEKLLAANQTLDKQVERLKNQQAQAKAEGLLRTAIPTVSGATVVVARVQDVDRQQMRWLADSVRNQCDSAVVVLGTSTADGKVEIGAWVKGLAGKVHAGKLVAKLAQAVGGKGGGRPDMAEGGGKDASALDAALDEQRNYLKSIL
jgi:alanyl-tRNA synthetase